MKREGNVDQKATIPDKAINEATEIMKKVLLIIHLVRKSGRSSNVVGNMRLQPVVLLDAGFVLKIPAAPHEAKVDSAVPHCGRNSRPEFHVCFRYINWRACSIICEQIVEKRRTRPNGAF
jgi:hypothetical protein